MVKKCALSAEVSASHTLPAPWKDSSSHFLSPRAPLYSHCDPKSCEETGARGAPGAGRTRSSSQHRGGKEQHWDTHCLSGPCDSPAGRVINPHDSWGNWGCEGQAISPRQCCERWDQQRAPGTLSDVGRGLLRGSDLQPREISMSSHELLPIGISKTQRELRSTNEGHPRVKNVFLCLNSYCNIIHPPQTDGS